MNNGTSLESIQETLRRMQQRNSKLLQGTQQQRGNLMTIEEEVAARKALRPKQVVAQSSGRKVLRRRRPA